MTVRDGGMLRARLLAALLRVRREANFHRNNDRKPGNEIQENVAVSIRPGGMQRRTRSMLTAL